MRITIDRERCMGSGNCAFHAPHTFDLGDDMIVVMLDPDGDPPDSVRSAVEGCPTRALQAEETSG